jgi:hypothetical protein
LLADAVRISGTIEQGCPANEFIALDKNWPDDIWKGYYVTWVSLTTGERHTQKITSVSRENRVTAESTWSPYPEIGAFYLIAKDISADSIETQYSIGSGTAGNFRWNQLPPGAVVHPYRIADNGNDLAESALPIVFASTGRAVIGAAYVNLKVYAKHEDGKINPDTVRYLRVYRNTGRVVTARTLQGLN